MRQLPIVDGALLDRIVGTGSDDFTPSEIDLKPFRCHTQWAGGTFLRNNTGKAETRSSTFDIITGISMACRWGLEKMGLAGRTEGSRFPCP